MAAGIHLLSSASGYEPNGLAYAGALTAAVILILGVAVLIRGRGALLSVLFFAISLTSSGWLCGYSLMYAATANPVALFWARATHVMIALTPPAVFHFTAVLVGRRRTLERWILLCWALGCVVAVTGAISPIFIAEVRAFSWGYYPAGTSYSISWTLIYAAMLAASYRLLWMSYRENEGEARLRARALLISFGIGSVALLDFLPTIGVDIYPMGYMALLGFTVVAANALWRYHLVDLTPEFAGGQILETMKSAVLVLDLAGKIRVANHAACTMLGYKDRDLLGQSIRLVADPEQSMSTGQLLKSMGVLEQGMRWRAANGGLIDVVASSSFVRDTDGTPVGVVYVASDVTEKLRADEALRESERRYRLLFDGNPLPMWVYDFESLDFISVNDAAVTHYGYSRDEFLAMKITTIRPPEDVPAVLAELPQLGDRSHQPYRHTKKDGSVIDVEITSFEFSTSGRRMRLVIALDQTERNRSEHLLRESEERFRMLFERNLAGVYRASLSGGILDCNDAFARIFGYENRHEILADKGIDLYVDPGERHRVRSQLREQRSMTNVEVRMRRRDGTPVWALANMSLLDGPAGEQEVVEGTLIDITERKSAQEQMEYQAYHDILTGLPNRLLFRDRITVALAHARRYARGVAVMFLDLDQFKLVNDTLGHTVGDGLLQAIAERLVHCVRAEDTVSRMGGDEFTILINDVLDVKAASLVAQKVLDSISQPVVVDTHELFVTTSIGVAMFPESGTDAETLLKNADWAMYRAKELGRNNFQFASSFPSSGAEERLSLESGLHHAIERGELVVHYQPMVEIDSGRILGAEALVRWNHPQLGFMYPEDFIPVAEESRLILPIGEWVMLTACTQMKQWHDSGHPGMRVAVNLSARQFQHRDLSGMIKRILSETAFPPSQLEIEITETAAMQNAELSLAIMRRLKKIGIRISIDDFGTGYASLSYLKQFPVDTLKIDQNFVRDLHHDSADGAIVNAVITMARALKLRVIAEGVETKEQLAFLAGQNCAEMQGFLFSRPMPAAEFEEALIKNRAAQ
ncbi:MAG TPA: EAL domain-containing protein [Thermoanaerobaculia bacterium]|nr:EAL domain-containing protein [Thermoanaerobaculia bacterium]